LIANLVANSSAVGLCRLGLEVRFPLPLLILQVRADTCVKNCLVLIFMFVLSEKNATLLNYFLYITLSDGSILKLFKPYLSL